MTQNVEIDAVPLRNTNSPTCVHQVGLFYSDHEKTFMIQQRLSPYQKLHASHAMAKAHRL
jgi:hypothetical protein